MLVLLECTPVRVAHPINAFCSPSLSQTHTAGTLEGSKSGRERKTTTKRLESTSRVAKDQSWKTMFSSRFKVPGYTKIAAQST
jgi:hypothetical protein